MLDLQHFRNKIDTIDEELLILLAKRCKVVKEVGGWKKENGITNPLDQNRWNELLKQRIAFGEDLGISEKFVRDIWEIIHQESLRIEK